MSEWKECVKVIHNDKFDAVELLTTFVLTVTCDLVVAILVAMVVHFIIIKLINKDNNNNIEVVC